MTKTTIYPLLKLGCIALTWNTTSLSAVDPILTAETSGCTGMTLWDSIPPTNHLL